MAKKSYFTKAELIDFGEWLLSDERRAKKQKETREAHGNGTLDPIPWSISVRILTEGDFKDWKNKRE